MAAAPSTEHRLLIRYHRHDDLRAREELVLRFLPLARNLAGRYTYTNEPFDDLVQVASLGLIKAIDRFDPSRGYRFTSYAVPTVLGELKRHFRDKGWSVHVPRGEQERSMAVTHETEKLVNRLGRSPSVREVAESLGWSVEETLQGREAGNSYEAASLDAPARCEDDATTLVETLGTDDPAYALVEDRHAVRRGWQTLDALEREVLELRFARDLTQREIGMRIGYSQMYVSRLLRRALNRLQTAGCSDSP